MALSLVDSRYTERVKENSLLAQEGKLPTVYPIPFQDKIVKGFGRIVGKKELEGKRYLVTFEMTALHSGEVRHFSTELNSNFGKVGMRFHVEFLGKGTHWFLESFAIVN